MPAAEDNPDRPGESYEEEHVHKVYQQIAHHFSSTRYKPWPIVERFLTELPPGSVGLDIGCGNGKYLPVNPNVFIVASDRSEALAAIASKHQPHSTVVADTLSLPHPGRKFDFAISIAVIHHLSLPERRVAAVTSILETLKQPCAADPVGGKALIYVWALEQKDSRRGWDKGDDQDVMVPWVLKAKRNSKNQSDEAKTSGEGHPPGVDEPTTYLRYYHLYKQNELETDVVAAGGRVLDHGYEKDNWWAIISPISSS